MKPMKRLIRFIPLVLCAAIFTAASCQTDPGKDRPKQPPVMRYQNLHQHTSSPEGIDTDPELTPDGTKLIFASSSHHNKLDLYEKNIDGATLRQITFDEESNERFPKVSPANPRMLAFCSDKEGEWDIYVIADYINNPREWKRISPEGTDDIHPSWSPDGTMIVYSSRSAPDGEWELKVYDIKTNSHYHLPIDGLLPEWNPVKGDNRILFQRMRHRGKWLGGVWTVKFVNGEALEPTEIIGSSDWAAINPSWSPDGKKICFATVAKSKERTTIYDEADDIWVANDNGSAITQITVDPSPDWLPVWAPNGAILFTSKRNGRQNIWSLNPLLP